ncbi:hypothetical protein OU995_10540 [Roseateles sp. SL47]|uniref:M61 family metallopeptidase n=1 Tax=Roseateles sp. SL47 TaxID=2995138 RepID=UPI00226D9A7C|nr:hypothetical protein [Roseateles sp. SL47]WAC75100.1 hypothetical protein OU995_10540 [Roseateles sp. SL47]
MSKTSTSEVSYQVHVDPVSHELQVTLQLTGPVAQGTLHLQTPSWVPGNYTFTQLGRDLFDVHAVSRKDGRPLAVHREGWQAYRIEGGDGDVTVSYRAWAYATDLGEPSGILDSQFAVLLGTRYLYTRQYLGACTVTYDLPPDWRGSVHHPSGAQKIGPLTWRYPSYEVLLDTPVVMGHYDLIRREVEGTPIFFAFVDRGVGFDAEVQGFVDQVCKVAAGFRQQFGSFPFDDYTFVLSLNPQSSWGLEHLTSTMCGLGPDVFTDPDQRAIGVRVCAHELFHAWNVRRLRPAPLKEVAEQLDSGSFTEGLWMAEGFTRYYEFLSCTRAGVYTPAQFFSNLVGYLQHLEVTPAYQRVSAADSSLATYLNHSPKYAGRACNCIDYYDKGMLIAFGVDAMLRLESPARTLDKAFRGFYEEYVEGGPSGKGYSTQEAIAYFRQLQPAIGDMLDATVRLPGGLTTDRLLQQLGFQPVLEEGYQLGLMFLNDGAPTIYNVLDNSPAGHSGLAPDDVITTINGFNFSPAALNWVGNRAEAVTIGVRRGHRSLTFIVKPKRHQRITRLRWEGSTSQAERLQSWLEQEFKPAAGETFEVSFYENFHGIETVI